MSREPTLRDLPAIFRIARVKYRERETDYLDRVSISVLQRHGMPLTRRNASHYNLGGATAAVCILLPVMLFFTCSPQDFVRHAYSWRLLVSAAPVFIPGMLWLTLKHSLPAFSLSVRHNTLSGLVMYVPLCLIYNLATPGQ